MTQIISKLLIANRGEIACRVIKTCREMGIATVAIYSDVDAQALHVRMADEAVYIGEAPAKSSYLKANDVVDIALRTGANAIHPGYGFLSENAEFADLCEQKGIVFVGPPSSAIRAMGSKSAAKSIMEKAGVPLVPGYHGDDQSPQTLRKFAQQTGYPVLLKAAAGGGGKGMRQVHQDSEFDDALAAAKREAVSSFGDDIMLVEKYLTQPRHVEIQVFCDKHGNGVYLFERDCSVQRRHQKVIEEAPAPGMTDALRAEMGEAALKAAHAIDYVGAGTVEFLLDIDGSFYFMEMNTRLQVEHPVTEMITSEDLVAWQLQVASGAMLPKTQAQLQCRGHAFEARIYAEDPDNDFLPATGMLSLLRPPAENNNVRVDTGVTEGDTVSVYYDPMIAKLVVWDEDRQRALTRLQTALRQYHIDGVVTNVNFLYNLACHPAFVNADLTTTFIERHQDSLFSETVSSDMALLPLLTLAVLLNNQQQTRFDSADATSPWSLHTDWRANSDHSQVITLEINGNSEEVRVERIHKDNGDVWRVRYNTHEWTVSGELRDVHLLANIDGHRLQASLSVQDQGYSLFTPSKAINFSQVLPDLGTHEDELAEDSFVAPMNGTVVTLLVSQGEKVSKGQGVVVLEAMKMEQTLNAPSDGKVSEFYYQPGDLVEGGAALLAFDADE